METSERWLPVNGFPLYEVSDLGRVRNRNTGYIKLHYLNRTGYLNVGLKVTGERKTYIKLVHRMMLKAFKPTDNDALESRHLDGNRTNNVITNLEWGTSKQNAADKEKYGMAPWQKLQRGESPNAKMTPDTIREMRALYAVGNISHSGLVKKFGVCESVVARILNRQAWTWVD